MTGKRLLLINPRICSPRAVRLPLSLLALGAVLEGDFDYHVVDGNLDPDATGTALRLLGDKPHALVGLTVMPGPQIAPAMEISKAIRSAHPSVPIVWGGYFPTLYPEAAINAPYVDYVVRGQGEDTLLDLLARIEDSGPPRPDDVSSASAPKSLEGLLGVTWKDGGQIKHNDPRPPRPPRAYPPLPYHRLPDVRPYLRPSFMGSRTGVYQAAVGCRYHCTFCGVVSMWNGTTHMPSAERLEHEVRTQRDRLGATAMQFYDHNFFDTEASSIPSLEVLARIALPWWCYARADTLANFSTATWRLIRRSRLRMAFIGAEAASDSVLRRMKKGSRVEHTFAAAQLCREYGVIPEFSFVLGGPEDPAGEIEKTFRFIKHLKGFHPECEVILYFYTPTPQRQAGSAATPTDAGRLPVMPTACAGRTLDLPTTPAEWTQKQWIDFVCHQDAPWLTPRLRRRVQDFATVLGCRFPTVQDYHLPPWGKTVLKTLASWRYATGTWGYPRELSWVAKRLRLRQPQQESL